MQSVLESLRLQGALDRTHVWIDGTQGLAQFHLMQECSLKIAHRFPIRELRSHQGNHGIDRVMLLALGEMSRLYDRVLILEDDCFPVQGAIDLFEQCLAEIVERLRLIRSMAAPMAPNRLTIWISAAFAAGVGPPIAINSTPYSPSYGRSF